MCKNGGCGNIESAISTEDFENLAFEDQIEEVSHRLRIPCFGRVGNLGYTKVELGMVMVSF